MPVHLIYQPDCVRARLLGEIDDHTAREMRETIDPAILRLRPKKLILDFTDVPFMDSSGIGLIIGRYKQMRLWQGEVTLCGMSRRIEMIVKLSGAQTVVSKERSEQHAG